MLKGKNIVVGVTGGIAAYKSVELVSRLRKLGADVHVIMTDHAREFVGELSFRSLSSNPVYNDMFGPPVNYDVEHISLAEKADIFILAPATANIIGKIANGIADDLLSTTVMASKAKVIFAPAMNTNMYLNPITQGNINKLKNLGYDFINPGTGRLACNTVGPGRMAEPEDIVNYVLNSLRQSRDLEGKKLVVTAGPTFEDIDPVRYIGNYSSGKMGYEIAKEARRRSADTVLITGPTNLERPEGVRVVEVKSADEMLRAIDREFEDLDILIKAAAVADYRVKLRSKHKLKKDPDKEELTLELVKNKDILEHFASKKEDRIVVGFAAETDNLIENARRKLSQKKADFIVANDVSKEGAGFNLDTNIVSIVDGQGVEDYSIMGKNEIAQIILDRVKLILDEKAR